MQSLTDNAQCQDFHLCWSRYELICHCCKFSSKVPGSTLIHPVRPLRVISPSTNPLRSPRRARRNPGRRHRPRRPTLERRPKIGERSPTDHRHRPRDSAPLSACFIPSHGAPQLSIYCDRSRRQAISHFRLRSLACQLHHHARPALLPGTLHFHSQPLYSREVPLSTNPQECLSAFREGSERLHRAGIGDVGGTDCAGACVAEIRF